MQLGSRQGHPKLGRVLLVDRVLDFQAKVPVSHFTQWVQLQSFGYLAILPAGCRSANGDQRTSALKDSQSVIGEVVDLLTAPQAVAFDDFSKQMLVRDAFGDPR
jgi:hypothetical protein